MRGVKVSITSSRTDSKLPGWECLLLLILVITVCESGDVDFWFIFCSNLRATRNQNLQGRAAVYLQDLRTQTRRQT